MKLFAWDELGCELQERQPAELFACNAEGGWVTQAWVEGLPPAEAVEIRTTGRHYSLETWCKTKKEAHRRFMLFETYRNDFGDKQ